jgi:hypothetical protein
VDALGYLRAGLRIIFETDDELAAFERYARELNDQALLLRHGSEQLARQEDELQMVRARLALHVKPPDLPPTPA